MSKMYQKLEVDEETGDTQNVKESASNKGNVNMESGLDLGQPGQNIIERGSFTTAKLN
jgi:hypothetical protein